MKKSFKGNFDDLLNSTVDNLLPKQQLASTPQVAEINYTRVTVAIKNDLLDEIRLNCLLKKRKLRDVINELIQQYLDAQK
jgi:hypothetical protein